MTSKTLSKLGVVSAVSLGFFVAGFARGDNPPPPPPPPAGSNSGAQSDFLSNYNHKPQKPDHSSCPGNRFWGGCLGPSSPIAASVTDITSSSIGADAMVSSNYTEQAKGLTAYYYERYTYECSDYFDRLIKSQDKSDFGDDITVQAGTAATSIMSLTKASNKATGVLGAVIGFLDAGFKSYRSRALVTPYPTETKTLILSRQQSYKATYQVDNVQNIAMAVSYINGFQELCSYSGVVRFSRQALTAAAVQNKSDTDNTGSINDEVARALGVKDIKESDVVDLYIFTNTLKSDPSLDTDKKSIIYKSISSEIKGDISSDGKSFKDSTKEVNLKQIAALTRLKFTLSGTFEKEVADRIKVLNSPDDAAKTPESPKTPESKSANDSKVPKTALIPQLQ